jgi:hypothetical protein
MTAALVGYSGLGLQVTGARELARCHVQGELVAQAIRSGWYAVLGPSPFGQVPDATLFRRPARRVARRVACLPGDHLDHGVAVVSGDSVGPRGDGTGRVRRPQAAAIAGDPHVLRLERGAVAAAAGVAPSDFLLVVSPDNPGSLPRRPGPRRTKDFSAFFYHAPKDATAPWPGSVEIDIATFGSRRAVEWPVWHPAAPSTGLGSLTDEGL